MLWVLIALVVLEVALQLTINPSKLYSRFHTAPQWNEWRNQVRFWEKHRASDPDNLQTAIGNDPVLGWDFMGQGDRIRGHRPSSPTPAPNTTRVIALGDSYVYGIDLAAEDTFTNLLMKRREGQDVLNMGIPGYGIDQAVIKYLEHGTKWQADVVVLGIYLTDYERSALRFTFSAKPLFTEVNGTYLRDSMPVELPSKALAEVAAAMQGRLYLAEAARNLYRKLMHTKAQDAAFFADNDQRVSAILSLLQHQLTPAQRLVVLHFPAAEQFDEPSSYRAQLHQRHSSQQDAYHRLDNPCRQSRYHAFCPKVAPAGPG